jgi:DNA-binding transcriptional regulator YiaG
VNSPLSKAGTGAYAGFRMGDHIADIDPKNDKAMRKSRSKSGTPPKPDWAANISDLRQNFNLSQSVFGGRLNSSAMSVSRWERGTHEPTAGSYIELGNLAGAPLCWYFWGRAGLRNEDFLRVMPEFERRLSRTNPINFQIATAGCGDKKLVPPKLAAIPLLSVAVASHGEKGDQSISLNDAQIESMFAAPLQWCPNPSSTTCLRVRGNSMAPVICDGYILVVDSSQRDASELNGKVVVAWNRNLGLTVSRLQRYGNAEVLQPENRAYEPIVLNGKHEWKILAKVLWWIGKPC